MNGNVIPMPQKLPWQEMIAGQLKDRPAVLLGNAEVYAVHSSDPMDFYYVLVFPDKIVCAKCKGFRFRETCKHVKMFEKEEGK